MVPKPPESLAKLLVRGIVWVLLLVYMALSVWNLILAFQKPVKRFYESPRDSIASPGLVMCADASRVPARWIDVSEQFSCHVLNPENSSVATPCALSRQRFAFQSIVTTPSDCVVLKPGEVTLTSPRQIIQITLGVYVNVTGSADFLSGLVYGFFADEDKMDEALVNAFPGAGYTIIDFRLVETQSLAQTDYTRSYRVYSSSSQPNTAASISERTSTDAVSPRLLEEFNITRGDPNFHWRFYLGQVVLSSGALEVEREEEVVRLNPGDVIGSMAAMYSVAQLVIDTFNGAGEHDPYGYLHRWFYSK